MLAWALALGAPGAMHWSVLAAMRWHAHEMLFGFTAAIVAGVALTALPSWPGTAEIHGRPLAALVALWVAGRAGVWIASASPIGWAAVADLLFVPALFASVMPPLLRVANKRYLLLLPLLAALYVAQVASHAIDDLGGADGPRVALHGAVYAIIVLYVLVGGLFTPVFTGTALRDKGRGDQVPFVLALEATAVALVVVLAALDLSGAPDVWVGAAALACTLVHGWRIARWKGWRAAGAPIVLAMNLGFAWLVAAFALRAAAAFGGFVAPGVWVHAFTVGGLGMMMIGLMTRVVLRHTGRPLAVPPTIVAAGAAIFAAALLRLAAGVHSLGNAPVAVAALLWALALCAWLARCAPMLLAPSLPRRTPQTTPSNSARE